MLPYLFLAFTFEQAHSTFVKTYSLVSFCFVLTLFLLTIPKREIIRYPLCALCALLAPLVRLSAIGFALPVVLYCLLAPRTPKVRIAVGGVILLVGSILFLLFSVDPYSVHWNLVEYHYSYWGDADLGQKLKLMLVSRIPQTVRFFARFLPLCAPILYYGYRSPAIRASFTQNRQYGVLVLGLGLFVLIHFTNGMFLYDYFVPVSASLLTLLAIVSGKVMKEGSYPSAAFQKALSVTFAITVIGIPLLHRDHHLNHDTKQAYSGVREAARVVAQNTTPNEPILAVSPLWLAVEARRNTLPGLSMAEFSYEDMPTSQAKRLKVVNHDLLLEYLELHQARVVVLCNYDLAMFDRASWMSDKPKEGSRLLEALHKHYDLIYTAENFRVMGSENESQGYVYLRKASERSDMVSAQ